MMTAATPEKNADISTATGSPVGRSRKLAPSPALSTELIDRFRELSALTRMLENEKASHERTRAELERVAAAETEVRTELDSAQRSYLALQEVMEGARQGEMQARTEMEQLSREVAQLCEALESARAAERQSQNAMESLAALHEDGERILESARGPLFNGIGLLVRLVIEALSRHMGQTSAEIAVGQMLLSSGLFDPDWYLAANPDVAGGELDPLEHYIRFGRDEGRNILSSLRGLTREGAQ
ncbi:hypothetical protein [Nitrospirillum sp. BR 11828]|uniref:hypothetical protein n=1 Tax=Nitrospirillum sp. BR 11828 TaxID=3104325 RepID=UPI002ACA0AFB|nr:hypothetical protein [Nitrospirillum sp. BR 11828]MDZ5645627.1 hypothetical protein [Nitrospirillum sp. BR 11828]